MGKCTDRYNFEAELEKRMGFKNPASFSELMNRDVDRMVESGFRKVKNKTKEQILKECQEDLEWRCGFGQNVRPGIRSGDIKKIEKESGEIRENDVESAKEICSRVEKAIAGYKSDHKQTFKEMQEELIERSESSETGITDMEFEGRII